MKGIKIEGYEKAMPRGHFSNYYSSGALGLIVFLIIATFIAPLTHESFHIMVLKQFDCPYTFSMYQTYEAGIFAEVTPLCALNDLEAVVFLAAGLMGNIFIAIFLSIFTLYARRRKLLIFANLLTFAMIGFASDPLFYFFAETGDIITILKIIGRSENLYMFRYMGYLLALSVFMYLWSHLSFTIEHKSKLQQEWERIKKLRERTEKKETNNKKKKSKKNS
ncbi:MAG: hypothetical protein JW716_00160 [Candidatus Aenigmarchaeota archaeon]|nr:hypothetical protein [Candidatus Aenigmarchaeota archaeon]